jgi:hypothetical protein
MNMLQGGTVGTAMIFIETGLGEKAFPADGVCYKCEAPNPNAHKKYVAICSAKSEKHTGCTSHWFHSY